MGTKIGGTLHAVSERIFSPSRLLFFLTLVNLLIYFDRGAIASVLPMISARYDLSITQEGFIASSFIVGYMICCPIFAMLASHVPMKYLVLFGLLMWGMASHMLAWSDFMTGEKWGYYMVLTSRAFIGMGESAFLSLGPTLVDEVAPPASRTVYMSIFLIGLPVGSALGYGVTGFLAVYVSWRAPFWLESGMMLVCLSIMAWMPSAQSIHKKAKRDELNHLFTDFGEQHTDSVETQKAALVIDAGMLLSDTKIARKKENAEGKFGEESAFGDVDDDDDDDMELSFLIDNDEANAQEKGKPKKHNMFTAALRLFLSPLWVTTVIACAFYTGVLGCLSFFAPSYITRSFGMDLEYASLVFSIISVVTGLTGTVFGGWVNDWVGGSAGKKGTANALLISFMVTAISFPFGAVTWFMQNIYAFFGLLFVAEFFLFAKTSSVNCALLSMVPPELKNYSMSYYIFLIHLFGDFPAPMLFGVVADNSSEFVAILCLWGTMIPCISLLLVASVIAFWVYKRHEATKTIMRLL